MSKGLINKMMLKEVLEDADYKDILTTLIDEGIISKSDVATYYSGEIAPFLRGPKYSEYYGDELRRFDIRDLTESGDAIIRERAKKIDDNAFANCSPVTKVVVPQGVEVIGRLAFNNCPNLETVELPKGLKEIEFGAFANCPKLININIPMFNVVMGKHVFYNTPAGEKFMQQLEERRLQLNKWSGVDKPMYSYIIGRKLVQFDERDLNENGEFVVPAQVQKIEDHFFKDCNKLIKIKFLPGLQEIGCSAFKRCRNLQEVEMSDTITKIGREAFSGCWNLKEIILPTGLERIEFEVFAYCGLEKVVLPNYLRSIGENAFLNCVNLKDVNVPNSVSYIHKCAFDNIGIDYKKLIREKGKCIEESWGDYGDYSIY